MMRTHGATALVAVSILLVGCSGGGSGSFDSAALDSGDQKASYGMGLNVGTQIVDAKDRLDRAAFMRGVEDALQSRDPAITREEIQASLQAFATEIQASAAAARESAAADNLAEGEAFLAENGARDGVVTTESGLQYEVLREGEGVSPGPEDEVNLHYRGTLTDGTEFDASYGGAPATFGVGAVIPGFSEALQLMTPGSHFRVVIPSDIAYGRQGAGADIGPNAVLIFEIELFEIVSQG